ncbi:beta-glucosidase [Oceanimonas marisflavi]|uniref:beta-glucosidase n=1 Tax=Oceanimonas marisflavi TaxID=2059724 RepID=UPI001E391282|nr:glycoside hydrolase family 3 C-terminal domain-containing protein [Oceanimonas marisflavi]
MLATVLLSFGLAADPGSNPHETLADALLDAMTLEQKIQQISNRPDENAGPQGDYLGQGNQFATCGFTPLGRHITGISELGIPNFREINGGNGIRGGSCVPEPVRTAGPSMTLAAASFDPELVYGWGEVVGDEAYTFASQVLLGPGLNLIRSPYAGRGQEYPGEDPFLAGVIGSAQIMGIQSRGVQAQPKHFLGNEHEYDFERWTAGVRIPGRALHELYLLPFEMAVRDARPASIMCAFPYLNDSDYICDSHDVLVKTLRERWGFDGWVESDRRAMHSTVKALKAGVGYELDSDPLFYSEANIQAALDAGEITEADIDAALRPRYVKMSEFGQFDNPFDKFLEPDLSTNAAKARALAEGGITLLKNEGDFLPLDKASNPSIALIGHPWFAGRATMPPRNLSRQGLTTVVPFFTISPQTGLEKYVSGVTYHNGVDIESAVALAQQSDIVVLMVGTNPRETRDLKSLILPTLCVDGNGGGGSDSGGDPEAPSDSGVAARAVLPPPPVEEPDCTGDQVQQDELVRQVSAANPNNVVVLYSASGIVMDWLEQVPALFAAWFPGQEEGDIMADLLFGALNPSGKLPVTFPASAREAAFATEAQYPGLREDNGLPGGKGFPQDGVFGDGSDQLVSNYTEGLEMGYRWYEANGVTPVFPFGHGLSYTRFAYSDLTLSKRFRREYTPRGWPGHGKHHGHHKPHSPLLMLAKLVPVLTVEYTVTNRGDRFGAEASQVYLKLPKQAEQPSKRLVGFEKVFLEPGESQRVSVEIDAGASNHPFSYFVPDYPDDLTKWAYGDWKEASGRYQVFVGGSSADTPLTGRIGMAFPQLGKPFHHMKKIWRGKWYQEWHEPDEGEDHQHKWSHYWHDKDKPGKGGKWKG